MNDEFRMPIRLLQAGIIACFLSIVAVALGIYTIHREIGAVESKLSTIQSSVEQTKILASGTTTGIIGLLQRASSAEEKPSK
jgi:hypothetical protein